MERHVERRGRIRLSAMEMTLIGVLLGSLLLALLQARQEERRANAARDLIHEQ